MKIFIPTVNRVDNQITYEGLPDSLKKKVVFVVQEWEREKYTYDAEYLVLPPHITLDNYLAIAMTRKEIYYAGAGEKYAVLDDDIVFRRRNEKYWTGISNMEKSKRLATHEDIIDMFNMFSQWLDEEDVSMCGCSFAGNSPTRKEFAKGASQGGVYWINGPDFAHLLDELPLEEVKTGEDTLFILSLLSRGYANKVSQEFVIDNHSVLDKNISSDIWDSQSLQDTERDHLIIHRIFPRFYELLYEEVYNESGIRVSGGFRNAGKTKTHWQKAYKEGYDKRFKADLMSFTN
jgi:hypothetical protein